jgi:hypothetical protein
MAALCRRHAIARAFKMAKTIESYNKFSLDFYAVYRRMGNDGLQSHSFL